MRRHVARLGALVLVALGLVVVTGGAASAHNASVSATCSQLTVSLTDYQQRAGEQNTVKVTVDGVLKADTTFVSGYSQSFPLADTVAHTWTVAVTAWDDPNGTNHWTFTKTGTTTPCHPKVTPAAPVYTPPSCTSAPTLTYHDGTGYHWVLSGPAGARILTAVAESGYVLDGTTVYGPYDTEPWTAAERLAHHCNVITLVRPTVHQSDTCGVNGSITQPVLALVTFTISGGTWGPLPAGDYTITATLTGDDAEFDTAATALGWNLDGRTATITVHLDAPRPCPTKVTPAAPTYTPPAARAPPR